MSPTSEEKALQQHQAGLKAALRIMKGWGVDDSDQSRILDVDQNILDSTEAFEALTERQLVTISYLLNIHASLREVFQNPENHLGFMTAANQNSPYFGRRPLDFVLTGEIDSLKTVYESLEQLKNGLW
ncbi:hypothetical protein [uncultured Marinobacter sp.]|jgi:hypothetical protein|uniref:hypothetical protein n=1 Tax=uncultured Marinobacter sp. TaxID=187379 RepID=UPI0030C7FB3E